MGRHKKIVMTGFGVDRRASGYYSTPNFVTEFITREMLALNSKGRTVLDPCVGKGEMTFAFEAADKDVTGWDIVDFKPRHVTHFEKRDFLKFYGNHIDECIMGISPQLDYDFYIANPPYNCHESDYIRANKSRLKSLFPKTGVANMYSMFISALITLAKPNSVLGILTNDSFLTSRLHQGLRKQIVDQCCITHMILCPVDLFWKQHADVRTCIMILIKKHTSTPPRRVSVLDRPATRSAFKDALQERQFDVEHISDLTLDSEHDRQEFVIGCPESVRKLFRYSRIGQVFQCVTGISTGNDKKYISKTLNDEHSVPFYKNPGSRRFFMEPDAYLCSDFMDVQKKVPNFIVRNKKLLFKPGITCSSMGIPFGACILPKGATFGVNANIFCKEDDRFWLLAYLNSSLVTYIVRGILLRTNMITSGYVSRIPIVPISHSNKKRLAKLASSAVREQIKKEDFPEAIKSIDDIVFTEAAIVKRDAKEIHSFCEHILKRT